jgi:hypothetical protein
LLLIDIANGRHARVLLLVQREVHGRHLPFCITLDFEELSCFEIEHRGNGVRRENLLCDIELRCDIVVKLSGE